MKGLILLPFLLLGQTVAVKREATWDHVTKDVQGNPENVVIYELAIAPPIVDLNISPQLALGGIQRIQTTSVIQADNTALYNFNPLVQVLGDGTYRFWVRAEDESGNKSVWTTTDFKIDKTAPAAVANLKIKITIEVTQ